MKLFFTFLFFFIFFTLSYSQRLEFLDLPVIDFTSINTVDPRNHLDHDHGSVSTIVDRATEDTTLLSHLTNSKPSEVIFDDNNNNKPEVMTTQFGIHYFGKNRRPVRLTNRFPFHRTTFRFFPRRCNHNEPNHRFIPGGEMDRNVVQFMFKKEEAMKKEVKIKKEKDKRVVPRGRNGGPFSDILVPRHVARKDEAEMNTMMFSRPRLPFRQTVPRHHHRDRAHDDEQDPHQKWVMFKKGKENDEKKMSEDDQKIRGKKHDDHDDGLKERGHEVLNKISKFLNYL